MNKSRQQFEEFISKGDYPWVKGIIPVMCMVWEASRESLEIELPKRKNICDNEFEDCFYDGVDKCREILLDNGVKIK